MVAYRKGRDYDASFSGDSCRVRILEGGEKILLENGAGEETVFEPAVLLEGFNGRKAEVGMIYTTANGAPADRLEHQPFGASHPRQVDSLQELAEEVGKEMDRRHSAYA